MERSKLKLAVIFLLAMLNLVLLGMVLLQNHQTRTYEETTRTQILAYLANHGITAEEGIIPWESSLSSAPEDLAGELLPDSTLPEEGLPSGYEIQTAREATTLLMDFVRGLESLGENCTALSAVTEGYHYSGQGDRAVLTPMWKMETDGGTYLLDCSEGTLCKAD